MLIVGSWPAGSYNGCAYTSQSYLYDCESPITHQPARVFCYNTSSNSPFFIFSFFVNTKKKKISHAVRAEMHCGGLTRYGQIQESRNDNCNDIKLYFIFHIECKDIELTRVVQ